MVRELREHSDLLLQWSTLVTPSYSDAGPDVSCKEEAFVWAELLRKSLDNWMSDLTTYHADRATNVLDVRQFCLNLFFVSQFGRSLQYIRPTIRLYIAVVDRSRS